MTKVSPSHGQINGDISILNLIMIKKYNSHNIFTYLIWKFARQKE